MELYLLCREDYDEWQSFDACFVRQMAKSLWWASIIWCESIISMLGLNTNTNKGLLIALWLTKHWDSKNIAAIIVKTTKEVIPINNDVGIVFCSKRKLNKNKQTKILVDMHFVVKSNFSSLDPVSSKSWLVLQQFTKQKLKVKSESFTFLQNQLSQPRLERVFLLS